MSYKDLLVVLDSGPDSAGRIAYAASLAERFAAHLVGLCALPTLGQPATAFAIEPSLLDPLYRQVREAVHEESERLARIFEQETTRRGVAGEWRVAPEGYAADPALHARYADLAILGQIDAGNPATALRPRPEHVALAAGRPVLVVPYAGKFEAAGRRILVGWNATREATRAIADAMPLLVAADAVGVLVIDPRQGPDAHGDVPGADISLYLARHGVKAEVERTYSADVPAGDVLLSRAADFGADLLVMGCYGHSRARETLLGGATRTILDSMTLPVLMSH